MKKLSNFVNGKSVDSTSGETTTLVNPATGQPFATAPNSNAADIRLNTLSFVTLMINPGAQIYWVAYSKTVTPTLI